MTIRFPGDSPCFISAARQIQWANICGMQITLDLPAAIWTRPAAQSSAGHLIIRMLSAFIISGMNPRLILQWKRQEINHWTGSASLSLLWTLLIRWTQTDQQHESQLAPRPQFKNPTSSSSIASKYVSSIFKYINYYISKWKKCKFQYYQRCSLIKWTGLCVPVLARSESRRIHLFNLWREW